MPMLPARGLHAVLTQVLAPPLPRGVLNTHFSSRTLLRASVQALPFVQTLQR